MSEIQGLSCVPVCGSAKRLEITSLRVWADPVQTCPSLNRHALLHENKQPGLPAIRFNMDNGLKALLPVSSVPAAVMLFMKLPLYCITVAIGEQQPKSRSAALSKTMDTKKGTFFVNAYFILHNCWKGTEAVIAPPYDRDFKRLGRQHSTGGN